MGWWTRVIDGIQVYYAWGDHGEYVLVAPQLNIVVARFGRQFGFDASRGDSSGGNPGVQIWPQVLTRIATTVATTTR
jgi:CubicO group peptidase (beta-lactamase class C family)